MGVPALFRWLSKKYPKIIYPVVEEEDTTMQGADGMNVVVPINIEGPNPNGEEFDNLYLDMNGIVHPCTHPEGKPPPETEEDMMTEIFLYTERVVAMVRPRKLLFMAIDGVAPRAKMNQQRSRRFRSSQEAKDKAEAHIEALALWDAMGKEVSDEERNKNDAAWDSNAITPGTPFMDLLAASLRYWVVKKMNTDPGWKELQVIISDAGVPGEGEHKIMDYIRRQRTNPGHNPNTRHVIYGLDADLIMLALATHEPYFRVLREDVFNDGSANACRTCGQEGHYAAQCTATKAEMKKPTPEKKPFIFLDVAILREYLGVELEVSQAAFPFDLERAIDDWVLLIFFVGNDFLPHLPSLEIREGAIDTLLTIWKQELHRMGGYLTDNGNLVLSRAQIILEGLAQREDNIFRKRREAEERQASNSKRRKLEADSKKDFSLGPSPTLALTANGVGPPSEFRHPLPVRPTNDFAANADSIGLGAAPTAESIQNVPAASLALAGSNRDVVANRRAIRMANMSAAEVLKAEMAGLIALKPAADSTPVKPPSDKTVAELPLADSPDKMKTDAPAPQVDQPMIDLFASTETTDEIPGFGARPASMVVESHPGDTSIGEKRKFEDGPGEAPDVPEDQPVEEGPLALKVNADGTVDQPDTVKLWEPGYRERYYRQKFGVELVDTEFRRQVVKSYVEGMVWVLKYYYQGAPSWQWYYPYHFAPFAADFVDIESLDITFELGAPFKPFEQLMGVFPAASRKHIPSVFHELMTEEDSPIIDFYPKTFEIDMNGKRMAWQGVALLPFIDQNRLLDAMNVQYPKLSPDEVRRNSWGHDVIFATDDHPIYPFYEQLYGKRKPGEALPIDTKLSGGISGSVLPNPDCLPGSTYESPLPAKEHPDIQQDRSLSVIYQFPKQLVPHRSIMLPGVKKPPRVLSAHDLETTRNGGRGRGRGGGFHDRGGSRGGYNNGQDRSRNDPFHGNNNRRGGGGGGGGGYDRPYRGNNNGPQQQGSGYPPRNYPPGPSGPPPQQHYGGYGGYGGGRDAGRGHDRPSYPSDRGNYQQPNYPPRPNYPPAPPPQQYGGYGAPNQAPPYGGYGAPNPAPPYGGYGHGPPPPHRGGYGGQRGGGSYNHQQGRGW